ncbi:Sigma-70 region 2 [Clostridiales bacterium oral taxon 876 str. F0540]|nr:Sigma-70 region 2 [Clostridiales bacterium oral taxon 876 str. F0540]
MKAKNGSQEDLLKILKQYKPFIFKTARNYNIRNHDLNDFEQIGYMAIINALSKYKAGSCTFSSYVYESIKNAFRYTARQNSKHENSLSLNSAQGPYERAEEYINCIDSEESIEETVLSSEESKDMRNAVAKLSPVDMELVAMLYYEGLSLRKYAEKKGLTYYEARKKKNFVLGKLENHFKQ